MVFYLRTLSRRLLSKGSAIIFCFFFRTKGCWRSADIGYTIRGDDDVGQYDINVEGVFLLF